MSSETDRPSDLHDPGRREIIRAAGAVTLASVAGSALVMNSPALGQDTPASDAATSTMGRNSVPLGARIQCVQHFGITVQNMDRA